MLVVQVSLSTRPFFEVVAAAMVVVVAAFGWRGGLRGGALSRAGHVGWGGAVPREA
jgi:hypothetical protein